MFEGFVPRWWTSLRRTESWGLVWGGEPQGWDWRAQKTHAVPSVVSTLLLNWDVSAQLILLSHALALPSWTWTPGNRSPIRWFFFRSCLSHRVLYSDRKVANTLTFHALHQTLPTLHKPLLFILKDFEIFLQWLNILSLGYMMASAYFTGRMQWASMIDGQRLDDPRTRQSGIRWTLDSSSPWR